MDGDKAPMVSDERKKDSKYNFDGYKSKRAVACKKGLFEVYRRTIQDVKDIVYNECKEILPKHEHQVKKLAREFKEKTLQAAFDEIELFFEEERLAESFERLDELHSEQKTKYGDKLVWRPSDSAEDDMAAHLFKILEDHETDLRGIYRQKKKDVEALKKDVNKKKKQLEDVAEEISKIRDSVHQDSLQIRSFVPVLKE